MELVVMTKIQRIGHSVIEYQLCAKRLINNGKEEVLDSINNITVRTTEEFNTGDVFKLVKKNAVS